MKCILKHIAVSLVIGVAGIAGTTAHAAPVNVDINVVVPSLYPAPQPVYGSPQPVYVQQRPVYLEQRPAYVQHDDWYWDCNKNKCKQKKEKKEKHHKHDRD